MVSHLDALRQEAGAFPQAPGVYFWRDDSGRILYIGKAINLRARVMSYFSNARRDRRTRDLLTRARHVTFELTGSELEALFRESALIKREQPSHNRLLREPRRLTYLKVDTSQLDPYLEIVTEVAGDGALYLGPFPSRSLARETVAYLHDVLPLRKCTAVKPRCRPCIYYQMAKCAAPMIDAEHRRRHEEAIARLHDLLDGRTDRLADWLRRKRDRLSESLLFEQAAEMQIRIDTLNDHRRQHAILEAAVACRYVVIRDHGTESDARVLLVAHGHVLAIRDLKALDVNGLAGWIRLHECLVDGAALEQNELDAASVLERWLRCNRRQARWVAIPHRASEEDLLERAAYILGAPVPAISGELLSV
jgi:excinuclease ABC subunit C